METKEVLKIVSKYCTEIKYNGKHYVCHLPNKKVVVISATPSSPNSHRNVYREFRRYGIILKEFKY